MGKQQRFLFYIAGIIGIIIGLVTTSNFGWVSILLVILTIVSLLSGRLSYEVLSEAGQPPRYTYTKKGMTWKVALATVSFVMTAYYFDWSIFKLISSPTLAFMMFSIGLMLRLKEDYIEELEG